MIRSTGKMQDFKYKDILEIDGKNEEKNILYDFCFACHFIQNK